MLHRNTILVEFTDILEDDLVFTFCCKQDK